MSEEHCRFLHSELLYGSLSQLSQVMYYLCDASRLKSNCDKIFCENGFVSDIQRFLFVNEVDFEIERCVATIFANFISSFEYDTLIQRRNKLPLFVEVTNEDTIKIKMI